MFEALAEFIAEIFKTDSKIRSESLVGESEFEKESRKSSAVVLIVLAAVWAAVWLYFEV